ncbi:MULTISPECIES: M48 family metallopeptidase [Halorussus]|uniref:M48 family metallopeptidase n=1 Tax=Halorussus TaxID=1070314 RepID=UPI00209D43C7|nr:M48 family metalloprotease [Halorussus vallis]USZ75474.1 M48 family metalloprotease [Halorussus vallis]
MKPSLRTRVWAVTAGLSFAAVLAALLVAATGASRVYVGSGSLAVAWISFQAYRSGGRFQFESETRLAEAQSAAGRGLASAPEIQAALLDVCERAGKSVPATVLVAMDAPGAKIGYDDGDPLLAVDPRLATVVGPAGLRAVFAHELGHLGRDLHTDAIRLHLPTVLGFGAFWLVALAGRGRAVAGLGSALFLALALSSDRRTALVRYALGLGAEPLALAASRYANRLEEFRADAYAARVVSPPELAEALYRMAAVATGDNDEDVAGPIPWTADRSLRFGLFATHPSVERRVERLGCDLPAWVRPYRPHLDGD